MRDFSSRSSSTAPRSRSAATSSSTLTPQQLAKRREAQRRAKRKRKITFVCIVVFFLFALVGLVFAIIFAINSLSGDDTLTPTGSPDPTNGIVETAKLPAGTMINGVSVGNMSISEARAALQQAQLPITNIAIALRGEGVDQTLDAAMIGAKWDFDSAFSAAVSGGNINAKLTCDAATLEASLISINQSIPNHAIDATFTIEYAESGKPTFVYTEGQNGMQLDYASIAAEIAAALEQGNYSAVIVPKVSVSEPNITVAKLKEQTTLLARYSTTYRFKGTTSMTEEEKQNCVARDINIIKASEAMRCIELEPGQVFSFNDTTGKRSAEKGWAEAKAVYGGGYRLEPGGGVCQVSTTLFNALIRSNIEIVYRRGHTIPSDYVTSKFEEGLGFDATVDYGHIDFKYRNNTDSKIYVFVYVTANKESSRKRDINVEVYGKAFEEGVEYRVRNEIIEHVIADTPEYEIDKKQPFDYDVIVRNAHDHYYVKSYVDKYVNGVKQETVMTFESDYPLIQEKHIVGTATPQPLTTPDAGGGEGGGDEGGGNIPIIP